MSKDIAEQLEDFDITVSASILADPQFDSVGFARAQIERRKQRLQGAEKTPQERDAEKQEKMK